MALKLTRRSAGGCLNMTNPTGESLDISNSSSGNSHIQCVMNMRAKDDDDLSDQLLDDWSVTDAARAELNAALNETLPLARHLQRDVFLYSPPTAHLVLFLISGIMLFVASTNTSPKRGYKFALILAVLFGAFALTMVYLSAIGSQKALNALVDGNDRKETQGLSGDVFVRRAGKLYAVQMGQLVCVSLFYILMGFMFL